MPSDPYSSSNCYNYTKALALLCQAYVVLHEIEDKAGIAVPEALKAVAFIKQMNEIKHKTEVISWWKPVLGDDELILLLAEVDDNDELCKDIKALKACICDENVVRVYNGTKKYANK